jgi:hypothetical protein
MAASHVPVNKMILPNMNVNEPVSYSFFESPQTTSLRYYTSNDVSNTNLSWTITPPSSSNSVLNKRVMKEFQVQLSITGTAPVGNYLYQSNYVCPRQFPVAACTSIESISMNQFQNSLNVSDVISGLAKYGSSYEQLGYEYAYCPSQPDFYVDPDMHTGSRMDPFDSINDQIFNVPPRNSIPKQIVANPVGAGATPVTTIINYLFYEPVWVSPFAVDDSATNEKGFANLDSLDINETFTSDLTRMFEFKTLPVGVTYTNVSVNIMGARLLMKWDSLPASIIPEPAIDYSYNIIDVYTTSLNNNVAVAPGTYPGSVTNAVEFKKVPKDIMIFVRQSNSSRTRYFSDFFCPIKNVSVSYQNVDSQMSAATNIQLYEVCRKNGLNTTSFAQSMMANNNNISLIGATGITTYVGTSNPLLLSIPDDIYLAPGVAVGMSNVSQFQATITYENFVNTALSLYVIAITPAIFTLSKGYSNVTSNFLPQASADLIPYSHVQMDVGRGLHGGKFRLGQSVKSFIHRGIRDFKKVSPYIDKGLSYAEKGAAAFAPEFLPEIEAAKKGFSRVKKATGGRLLSQNDKMALVRAAKRNNQLYLR